MIELSSEARDFLKNHTVLRAGALPQWAPFSYYEQAAKGISIDYLETLGEILDVEIEWVEQKSWSEMQTMLIQGELDLLVNILPTDRREREMLFTQGYLNLNPAFTLNEENAPLFSPHNQRITYVNDYLAAELLLSSYEQVQLEPVQSTMQGLQMVARGEAHAYLDDFYSIRFFSETSDFSQLTTIPYDVGHPSSLKTLSIAVRKDWPELLQALDGAMPYVYFEEKQEILGRYIHGSVKDLEDNIFSVGSRYAASEIRWLEENRNRSIDLFFLDDLPPITYYDDEGEPQGVVRGYTDALEDALGIEFNYIGHNLSVPQGFHMIKEGNIQLVSSMSETQERSQFLDFSVPYIELPIMIYGRKGQPYISDLLMLAEKDIYVVNGHAIFDWIQRDYPQLNLITVDNELEGLRKAARSSSNYFIGSAATISNTLMNHFVENVVILGTTDYSYNLSMAISLGDSLPMELLNKEIIQIRENQGAVIESYWMNQDLQGSLDPGLLRWILVIVSMVVLLFVIYTYRAYIRRKLLEEHAITDHLTGLYNRRFLQTIYPSEQKRASREGRFFVFMIFDIDNFKSYNDKYGHRQGDVVLASVASSMRKVFRRGGDHLFRLGGEEFGVLTTVSKKEHGMKRANILRELVLSMEIPHLGNEKEKVLSISGGVMVVESSNTPSFDDLYQWADEYLYKAKNSGRNRVEGGVLLQNDDE